MTLSYSPNRRNMMLVTEKWDVPFWEQRAGGGPVTNQLIDRAWTRLVHWARRQASQQAPGCRAMDEDQVLEELELQRDQLARQLELQRDRSFVVKKAPVDRRFIHEFTGGRAPDAWAIMQGRNPYMLDSGLRGWAMKLQDWQRR